MNAKIVISTIGKLLFIEGLLLLIPTCAGIYFKETATLSLGVVAVLSIIVGLLSKLLKPTKTMIRAREGFVITGLSWFILSMVGAIPFLISGAIPSFTDAVFETASGFTTTGASIITDLESMPRCLLLWRSFTHWIGGMGILMFMLIFIPSNADEMNIMRAESPGPSVEKVVPKVRETALILYAIYTVLTTSLIIALFIAGMPLFDSVCISWGTAGTGGFGVHSSSIADYSSTCQVIITVGMLLFGINFSVYTLIVMRKFKNLLHCEEVFWYLMIFLAATTFVTLGTYAGTTEFFGWTGFDTFDTLGDAIHHSAFQVASIMTTTGFATRDFAAWSFLPRAVLVMIMFSGACAGSTGGGVKVSRIVLYVKQVFQEFSHFVHPNAVTRVRLDGKSVDNAVLRTTNVFLMAFITVFTVSFIIICFDGYDLETSFSSVAATINNIGPGLGLVGPTGSFCGFSKLSKWVFIFDMIAGRLELFPILIMLSPRTWRRK
ncbi:MAG: TrkH family potassium uptake protein [Eubacterium sp.]|nr:TrkH family potassium uptake protein [Eubacterium sp.]